MAMNLSAVEWDAVINRLDEHDKKLDRLLDIMNEVQTENERLKMLLKSDMNMKYGGITKIRT